MIRLTYPRKVYLALTFMILPLLFIGYITDNPTYYSVVDTRKIQDPEIRNYVVKWILNCLEKSELGRPKECPPEERIRVVKIGARGP